MSAPHWRTARRTLSLQRPLVMGILNLTPDSFSDGGRLSTVDAAIATAEAMIAACVDILDVGGESTRPGAEAVAEPEELRRVVPVVEALARRYATPISVDTMKSAVMRAAMDVGAEIINDVSALSAPGALSVAASAHAGVCLMHMQGEPRSMQHNPQYNDVVDEVVRFLRARMHACTDAGIEADAIAIDPGIGFGKRLDDNLALLRATPALAALGAPLLIGVSRKSLFGALLGVAVDQRLVSSVVTALQAAVMGAKILRVHDVPETIHALKLGRALGLPLGSD